MWALASARSALPAPLRFPGLDGEREYAVRVLPFGDGPRVLHAAPPPWLGRDDVVLPGRVLAEVGLPAPLLLPGQALVVHLLATGGPLDVRG